VLQRHIVSCCIGHLLPQSLDALLTELKLTGVGIERQLEQLLALNSDNVQVRSKLKLCKIRTAFAKPDMCNEIAVMVHILNTADGVIWKVLGHGKERPRLTLTEFLDPASSPLASAQHEFAMLLETWAIGDGGPWPILQAMGYRAEVDSLHLRRSARRELLQVGAGFYIHFDMRLRRSPYREMWLCLCCSSSGAPGRRVGHLRHTP
jgi:hypothetical protein